MRDWAQDALLTSEEIDKERGVIREEMKQPRAQRRMQDQYLPVLFNGSLYAERLPIGTEAVITGFKHQRSSGTSTDAGTDLSCGLSSSSAISIL